ncbi:hypothetical protein TNCV_2534031 [Trichonephila clavipes]|nr:hypothetical protein TNCV_2534031 [Trichonephila clavipes]
MAEAHASTSPAISTRDCPQRQRENVPTILKPTGDVTSADPKNRLPPHSHTGGNSFEAAAEISHRKLSPEKGFAKMREKFPLVTERNEKWFLGYSIQLTSTQFGAFTLRIPLSLSCVYSDEDTLERRLSESIGNRHRSDNRTQSMQYMKPDTVRILKIITCGNVFEEKAK